MNTSYLTRVRKLFDNPLSPRSVNRHNMRGWVKSIRFLTFHSKKKWLLLNTVAKLKGVHDGHN